MKKTVVLSLVFAFCAAVGLAHGKAIEATITKVDKTAKSMVVKTADGKDMTIYWNASTKVYGVPKEGEPIQIKATPDKDGKSWATWLHVGPVTVKAAPQAK
jgi:hypothetical protein